MNEKIYLHITVTKENNNKVSKGYNPKIHRYLHVIYLGDLDIES